MIATERRSVTDDGGERRPVIPYANVASARVAVAVAYAWSPLSDAIAATISAVRGELHGPALTIGVLTAAVRLAIASVAVNTRSRIAATALFAAGLPGLGLVFGGDAIDDGETGPGAGAERGRRGALEAGGRLLPRDDQGEPGGALLSPRARAAERGDGRAFPDRLCQPDARVPAAAEEPQDRRRVARGIAATRHLARERPRALQRIDRDPDRRRSGPGDRDVRSQDHPPGCGPARRCTCTCRVRTGASSTRRRYARAGRSSCARRCSTR